MSARFTAQLTVVARRVGQEPRLLVHLTLNPTTSLAVQRLPAIAVAMLLALRAALPARAVESVWAYPGTTGRLIYAPDAQGDRVLEFSDVGYRGAGLNLIPDNVPTVVTVSPVAGD